MQRPAAAAGYRRCASPALLHSAPLDQPTLKNTQRTRLTPLATLYHCACASIRVFKTLEPAFSAHQKPPPGARRRQRQRHRQPAAYKPQKFIEIYSKDNLCSYQRALFNFTDKTMFKRTYSPGKHMNFEV